MVHGVITYTYFEHMNERLFREIGEFLKISVNVAFFYLIFSFYLWKIELFSQLLIYVCIYHLQGHIKKFLLEKIFN